MAAKTETKTPKKKEAKVYRFKSDYPALTVASLGVQFIEGYTEVKDLAVARALSTIDGVSLVEE